MSPTSTAIVVAVLVLAATAATVKAFRPAPLTLRAVRARVHPSAPGVGGDVSWPVRVGRPLAQGSTIGALVDDRLGAALRLAGTTSAALVGTVVISIVTATFVTLVAIAALVAAGVVGGSILMWAWVPAVGLLFGWRVVADVRARANRRAVELKRSVNDFVQLLAVALTTNRSVEEAVSFAADAGEGYGFDLIRRTIDNAQPMGLTVWDALAAMADTYQLDQLRALSTSLQRQASVGVSVAATIRTEAAVMRAAQLAELTDRADKANANLSLPTMGMVFGMVLFLAYPVMTQISEAFT